MNTGFERTTMANWNLSKRLFVGVGSLVVLLVISGLVSFATGRSMKTQLDLATKKTARQQELALQLQRDGVSLSNLQRGLLLAALGGDQNGLTQIRQSVATLRADMKKRLDEMNELLAGREDGLRLVNELRGSGSEWDSTEAEVEKLVVEGNAAGAWDVARQRSAPLLTKLNDTAVRLTAMQNKAFTDTIASGDDSYRIMLWITMGVFAASILLAVIVRWVVKGIIVTLRAATHDLAQGAQHVATASSQVASASQSLSQGATEQAASLEQTSASMEEIASMTRMNAENTHQAAGMMADAEKQVHGANNALSAMVASMSAIKESSDKVSKIIKTIDEIAFQTNILALNAAVEAARAGEAGMGFAVVADEVRTLAQRSAQAAKDTAVLIEESIAKANDGNQKVNLVTSAIAAITESSVKAKGLVDEVSVASRQQSQGIEQVSQAIAQMEKVTQTNAASAEESAAVSQELSAQAEEASSVVRRLMDLVGTDSRDTAARVEAAPSRKSVMRMPRTSKTKVAQPTPAEQIPFEESTGTYGGF
jgi:methyl-accepting chemotaxis protein/methyl-accepting chemotaxis protein-1 (serine sensor receptor)